MKPVVTWCLIAINLAIFVYEAGASQLALDRMIDTFSLTPAALTGEMSARGWVPAWATLLTYQFFHAEILHLLGNMVFLWVFGDDIERALGRIPLSRLLSALRDRRPVLRWIMTRIPRSS